MQGSPRHVDDQARQYQDASPEVLLQQLNENWTKLRTFERAVADREIVIGGLHKSVEQRDVAIKKLNNLLRFSRVKVALMYALIGGAAAKGAEELVVTLAHFAIAWLRHHS